MKRYLVMLAIAWWSFAIASPDSPVTGTPPQVSPPNGSGPHPVAQPAAQDWSQPPPVQPSEPLEAAPTAVCTSFQSRRQQAYSLGLSAQVLLPNGLPSFSNSLPAYGITFGIPLGDDTIEIEGHSGSASGVTLYMAEADYRFNLTTPFFTGFLLAGVHVLQYGLTGASYAYLGGLGGLGLSLAMARNFTIDLAMKVYVQERAIVAFGGGFSIPL